MRKLVLLCTSLYAVVLLISASPVHAQKVFWVGANGSDLNNCDTFNLCATIQRAIDRGVAQNPGTPFEVNCLNSGSFSGGAPITITQSMTIDCGTGNNATIWASLPNSAITINTPFGATVVLRHLGLNGVGSGAYGIRTASFPSGTLIVDDCRIEGFRGGYGISFTPSAGRGVLKVSNSQIFDNVGGIVVAPSNGQIASVTLNNVELVANVFYGLALTNSGSGVVAGTMRHSVASSNGTAGVIADASQVYFTIEESSIVANLTYGIQTNSAGTILNVGASTIGGNGTGVKATAGQIISFGDNHMSANGTKGSFTSSAALD